MHPAKYGRCLFKLSQALRRVPGREAEAEADQCLKEAAELYFGIVGTNRIGDLEELEVTDFDALIHLSQR